jgi:putative ABC transport system ATP-binding protein
MSAAMVEFVGVSKAYTKGRLSVPVFENLSIKIPEGDFVAVMGPSGSGKTTILNLLAGFDRPNSGKVLVDGTDVGSLDENQLGRWRLNTVGFVFQQFNLIQALKAHENVEVPLRNLGVARAQRKENVQRVLSIVGLTERADHYPNELSGGEEQRVAIARALVSDPKLLVADEPTGNLDATAAARVMEILTLLNEKLKKTIIVVTHDAGVAAKARRILRLRKGVLEQDEPAGAPAAAAAPA